MKKICFLVNNTYKSGGVQRVSAVIANALADEYEITFLSYHMNIHNKKIQRTISAVIVIILVLAMVVPSLLGILGY